MKTYTSVKVYGFNVPTAWYFKDNPFDENFNQQEEYIVQHLLKNKQKIQCHFDSNGFRKSDSLSDSKLWFFGCSHTFGQAMNYEDCFATITAKELNLPFYNFGTPGASINLIARLLFKLRNQIKDKKIIILLPRYTRYETLIDNNFRNLNPIQEEFKDYLPINNIDGFLEYNTLQSVMLIKTILTDCQYTIMIDYQSKNFDSLKPTNIENLIVDVSGDGYHYGIETNKNIANFLINRLK